MAACRELQCGVPQLEPPRAVGFSLGGSLALGWMAQVRGGRGAAMGQLWGSRGAAAGCPKWGPPPSHPG